MAKFKTPRPKTKTPEPRAGWPCLVLVIAALVGIFLLLFLVMKYAS